MAQRYGGSISPQASKNMISANRYRKLMQRIVKDLKIKQADFVPLINEL